MISVERLRKREKTFDITTEKMWESFRDDRESFHSTTTVTTKIKFTGNRRQPIRRRDNHSVYYCVQEQYKAHIIHLLYISTATPHIHTNIVRFPSHRKMATTTTRPVLFILRRFRYALSGEF